MAAAAAARGIIFDDNGANLVRRRAEARERRRHPQRRHDDRALQPAGALLADEHVPVTLEVNIETKFTGDHEHGFDTVAEIPGTDPKLKDEVVMVGGHLD